MYGWSVSAYMRALALVRPSLLRTSVCALYCYLIFRSCARVLREHNIRCVGRVLGTRAILCYFGFLFFFL